MAELIGGRLEVTSKPNIGTTVFMTFPSQSNDVAPLPIPERRYG
jgi:signal transduction histidine kinase